ncbi:hypothetical protein [Sphingomonas mollis]|uniref:hypothetical protein n=1 Tax=Sphingomonas mollis TaxID=2795726 RepID=UPI001E49A774|nr:hypothetical protein [Sphingomonas sp. BT553]
MSTALFFGAEVRLDDFRVVGVAAERFVVRGLGGTFAAAAGLADATASSVFALAARGFAAADLAGVVERRRAGFLAGVSAVAGVSASAMVGSLEKMVPGA